MKLQMTDCLVFCLALLVAAPATAGRVTHPPVTFSNGAAYGSMQGARRSADTVQYIGCAINSPDAQFNTRYAYCDAVNAQGQRKICYTTDPGMMATAQSVSAYSYISFRTDAQNRCIAIDTWMGSGNLP